MTDQAQEREHAIRAPSAAAGWRRCKGKINAEAGLPDRVGREAAEGTIFHEHAELALRLGLGPKHFKQGLMQTIDGHTVCFNEEMVEAMEPGLAYVYNRMLEADDSILLVEQRVSIEEWTFEKRAKGTSDVIIIFPSLKLIIIFDWKYGKISVSPYRNDQMFLYCLGVWRDHAEKHFPGVDPAEINVEFTIWQPRVPGGGGTWPTTMAEVLEEGEKIKEDALATYEPDAPRTAGTKQCLYCKASATCVELAKFNLSQFDLHYHDLDTGIELDLEPPEPDFDAWTAERRSYVLLHWKTFKRWHDKLVEASLLDAAAGKPTPMMKAVRGNAGRRIYRASDKETVKGLLIKLLGRDKALVTELITPAVAEKLLGKKTYRAQLGDYVVTPPGKIIMVPETDGRPREKTIGQKFDELLSEDDDNGDEE